MVDSACCIFTQCIHCANIASLWLQAGDAADSAGTAPQTTVSQVVAAYLAEHGIKQEDAAYHKLQASICSFVTTDWLSALEEYYTTAASAKSKSRQGEHCGSIAHT